MSDPNREKAVRSLKQQAVAQYRWLQEHKAGDCPRGGIGDRCADYAYHQGLMVGLWRALEELGVERPASETACP